MGAHQVISANATAIRFICAEKGKNVKKTVKPISRGNTRSNTALLNAHKPQNNAVNWDTGRRYGVGRKGGARFLTQADRKSRLLLAAKVPNGTAEAVRDALIQMFNPLPAEKLRSITSDRGHEFAKHSEVSDALRGVPFYFADPYSPWQRGPMKTPTVCCGNISRKKHPLMMFPMLSLRTLLQRSIFALANALTGYLPLKSSLIPCCT